MSITHSKVSTVADSGLDPQLVKPGDWNAAHTITGKLPIAHTPNINRLAGIIATFDTFDTNPTNPANMTDGDWATEAGEGVETVTVLTTLNRTIGNIYFDMGTVHPITILAHISPHRQSGDGLINMYIERSEDAITYVSPGTYAIANAASDLYRTHLTQGMYARYFRLRFVTSGVTNDPSVFHVKVAEVMALQLI